MSQAYLNNLIGKKKNPYDDLITADKQAGSNPVTTTVSKVGDPYGIKPSSNKHLAEQEMIEADKKAGSYDTPSVEPKPVSSTTGTKKTKTSDTKTSDTPSTPTAYSDIPADPIIYDTPIQPTDEHHFVDVYGNDVPSGGGDASGASNPNTYGIDPSQRAEYMTAFQTTPEIAQANAYLDEMLAKMKNGRTSFSDRLDSLIADYGNREKFSYNPYADTLFQNQLSMAMNSGKQAMIDSMGQASALTGGYGSTYAQAVGNASYNQQIQNAYDNLPEYYNMALNQYQMEGDQMLQNIALTQQQDDNEWARFMNAYSAQNDAYNRLYNEARTNYTDRQNQLLNSMNMDNSNYWKQTDDEYRKAESLREQSNIDRNYNEDVRRYDNDDAFRRSEVEREQSNIDRNYNEDVRRYDNDDAFRKSESERNQSNLDRDFAEGQRQFDSNQSYKYSALAQDAKQHADNMALGWANHDLNQEKLDISNSTPSGSTFAPPTKSSSYNDIVDAYNSGAISKSEYDSLIKDKYNISNSAIDKGVDAMLKGFKGTYGEEAILLYVRTYFGNAPEDVQGDIAEQILEIGYEAGMSNIKSTAKRLFK